MSLLFGTPHARGAGYYFNDDRASGGQKVEAHVQTCKHCQAVVLLEEWKKRGGFCTGCNSPVCLACAKRMQHDGCRPFLQQLEEAVEGQERLAHFRKLAGLEPEPQQAPFSGLIIAR